MANNTLLASDNFASGSLAAGWSSVFGLTKSAVVSQKAQPAATATNYGQIWTGVTFPSNQTSEVTIANLPASQDNSNFLSLVVRYATGSVSGYRADIVWTTLHNYVVTIYSFTNGSPTTLVTINDALGGVAAANGDVFSFSANGACLTVYYNWKSILTVADPTYTSGSPGFQQYAQTTVTNNQVAAWRGYSAVQQDGIWQKQGVVVPATAADLSPAHSPSYGIQCHSQVIYEGGAQILSGTVYKMWVDNKWDLFYLESTDGINWTRSAGAVLIGCGNSAVVKSGSTYYLYSQTTANEALGHVRVHTSSDGVNWTLQASDILVLGSAGAWDSTNVDPFFAITVQGGTFYGLYLGYKTGATYFSVGLATSSDGITWTKYVGNPVLTGGNFCGLVKAGSTYYSWLQTTAAGRDAGGPFFDPASSVRYQSIDFINWTTPTISVQNSQVFESLNTAIGYGTISCLIDVGGKAYAYIGCSPGDSVTPIIGQIELAIAPASTAAVVAQPENALSSLATDTFARADGGLGANWTTPAGGTALQIASHLVEPSATSVSCQAVYTGASFGANQYSELTMQTLSDAVFGQGAVVPSVRMSTSALTDYEVNILSPAGTRDAAATIYRRVAGTPTQIGPTATMTPQSGDVYRLSVVNGSDGFPVLSFYQNGFLILQVQDASASALTTGSPGIQAYSFTAITKTQMSAWAGGNAAVIPNYPAAGSGAFDILYEDKLWVTRVVSGL